MSNKMLIDATHPEETRVVVLRGNRVEEFDFEAADRQQLRGNIYLAKVTRVEPSLQAAFVDYGGNRHGFLAFSEIHPDYYQIPFADRQALIQEQAREEEEEAAEDEAAEAAEAAAGGDASRDDARGDDAGGDPPPMDNAGAAIPEARAPDEERSEPAWENSDEAHDEAGNGNLVADAPMEDASTASRSAAEEDAGPRSLDNDPDAGARDHLDADRPARDHLEIGHDEPEHVESVGAEDALEEVPERRKPRPRQYKIQEVIKRRQVLLVQVVKEERGNKGAALTTYLSLAGRYSVLMPNTGRGGGISRKITNAADRKRLKEIASELDVPQGMGVILRTAGANRTRAEVKRDFEYLLRLWENVRELTLRSSAPQLVYEEGSLIKRSIRDLYSREIEQVVVAGDNAYREAKDFMRMLMPSHAKNVQQYRDDVPIFARSGVEAQLDAMFSPQVTLKSGGYIVINQTEALVSIDVNSGRSTREHSIEDTALNTNLEASEEIARQLRLRDLAGLIVIDFIDMEENRNNRAVERKLKDCLRADRARIQVGRISHFGLMEMSRQRIRTGVLESSTVLCPHCRGTGQVRSISSLSLQILRAVEEALLRQSNHHLYVRTRPDVALYVLNQKRGHLAQLEERFRLTITVTADAPTGGAGFLVERGGPVEDRPERVSPVALPVMPEVPEEDDLELDSELEPEEIAEAEGPEETGESRGPRRSRRRRRRGGNGDARPDRIQAAEPEEQGPDPGVDDDESEAEGAEVEASGAETQSADTHEQEEARRRRRGRRGGRRRGRGRENGDLAGNGRSGEMGATSDASDASDDDFASDEAFAPDDPSDDEAAPRIHTAANDAGADELRSELNAGDELTPSFSDGEPRRDAHAEEIEALTAVAAERDDGPARDEQAVSGSPTWGPVPAEAAPEVVSTAGLDSVDGAPSTAASADTAPLIEPAAPTRAAEPEAAEPEPVPAPEAIDDNRPRRSGWWNRRSLF